MLTSTKGVTADADAVDATPSDSETFREEIRVYFRPVKPRTDFDDPLFLIDDDVFETGHRDLYTRRRGKARVQVVPSTPDREGSTCGAKLPKLQCDAPGQLHIGEGYIILSRTIALRSSTVPGRTEHADICEFEFIQ
jgi:hypothetical protein